MATIRTPSSELVDCKSCAAIMGNGTSSLSYSTGTPWAARALHARSQIATQVGLDSGRAHLRSDRTCGNGCTTTSGCRPSKRAAFPGYVMVRVGSLALNGLAPVVISRASVSRECACRGTSGPAERCVVTLHAGTGHRGADEAESLRATLSMADHVMAERVTRAGDARGSGQRHSLGRPGLHRHRGSGARHPRRGPDRAGRGLRDVRSSRRSRWPRPLRRAGVRAELRVTTFFIR